jgi:hypothetical protein
MLCENVVQVYWQPNYFLVSVSRFEMPKRNQRILTEEITETQKCYSLFARGDELDGWLAEKKSTLSIETISAKRRGKNQPFPLKQKSRLELTIVEQRLPLFWLRKISEDSFKVLNFLVTRSIKNLLSSAMTIGKKKWWLSTFMHIFRLVIFDVKNFFCSR